jgi:hypothetical protein
MNISKTDEHAFGIKKILFLQIQVIKMNSHEIENLKSRPY